MISSMSDDLDVVVAVEINETACCFDDDLFHGAHPHWVESSKDAENVALRAA